MPNQSYLAMDIVSFGNKYAFFGAASISLCVLFYYSPFVRNLWYRPESPSTTEDELKEICATTIKRFLRNISYRLDPNVRIDSTMEGRVEDSLKENEVSMEVIQRIQPYTQASVSIACLAYPLISTKLQEAVALFTLYAVIQDDLGPDFQGEMKSFVSRLVLGQPQQNEFLRGTCWWLKDYCKLFGQVGGDMIAKSSIDFICGCYIESDREKLKGSAASEPKFAEFMRLKTGLAEAYSFFLFPEEQFPEDDFLEFYIPAIPYIMQYFNDVNDIFSFYKEAGEYDNFIQNHARAHQLTTFQSLELTRENATRVVQMIRKIAASNEAIYESIEGLLNGYVTFHLYSDRYKLFELDIPEVLEARRAFQPMS